MKMDGVFTQDGGNGCRNFLQYVKPINYSRSPLQPVHELIETKHVNHLIAAFAAGSAVFHRYDGSSLTDVSILSPYFSILECKVGLERPRRFAAWDRFPPVMLRASLMTIPAK